ncbi:MAG: BatA domain-containing protein, partial [Isosphaeraceae bacterium]
MSPITFVTVGLTAGAALAALPVIIHLIMRQTPKHIIFPALRLIKQRQKQSRKRLRIRNWLLLLARMVLIALMALALARPKVSSQTSLGDQEVPNALALVFDTSLSMEYREQDKSRLREGQDRALEILGRSHESSQVFVIDSAEPVAPVAMSPSAARKRVESLTIRPINRTLNQAMGLAYKAVAGVDLPRHEVFVFTDLARSAWELGPGKTAEGLEFRKKVKEGISTYVIRLSPKDLRDVAIVEAEPIGGLATQGEPIQVKVKLRSIGPATKRRVELRIDDVPRAVKEVDIPANGEVDLPPLVTPKLPAGLHQGEVRLTGEPDPLSFDDVRYFTINVQPPLKVLIVYERAIDAEFVKNALDPDVLSVGAPRPYHVTRLAAAGMSTQLPEFLK